MLGDRVGFRARVGSRNPHDLAFKKVDWGANEFFACIFQSSTMAELAFFVGLGL